MLCVTAGVIGTSSESDVTGNFGVGEITKFKDSGNMATGTGENSICVMTDRSASPAAQFELHGEVVVFLFLSSFTAELLASMYLLICGINLSVMPHYF